MAKVKKVHFVCRDGENIIERPNGLFVSGYWKLGADVALSVEEVFLHQSKDDASYRQGRVVERHLVPFEGDMRYIFVCEPYEDNFAWEGHGVGGKGYVYH